MDERFNTNKIDYVQICRRLIHFSIRQHFLMEDALPLNLISQSANKILLDLSKHNTHLSIDSEFVKIREEIDRIYRDLRQPYNALKHADKDKTGLNNGNFFALNEAITIINIIIYLKLGGTLSTNIVFFYICGYVIDPNTYGGSDQSKSLPSWLSDKGALIAEVAAQLGTRATRRRMRDAYKKLPQINVEFEEDNRDINDWIDFLFSQSSTAAGK